jgi:hypothetical protein
MICMLNVIFVIKSRRKEKKISQKGKENTQELGADGTIILK